MVEEYRGAQQPLVVVEIGTALGGTVETSGWVRSTWGITISTPVQPWDSNPHKWCNSLEWAMVERSAESQSYDAEHQGLVANSNALVLAQCKLELPCLFRLTMGD